MDFHSVISQLKTLDEEMLSLPIKNISNEDLKKLYSLVAEIRESSNLLWRVPFLEMCARDLFNSGNTPDAA